MAKMELADCMLNIGGDVGNQVPKTAITPAEIAILRAIHGEDSVHDIRPLDIAERDPHDEMDAIQAFYGWKEENAKLIQRVFPTVSNMPTRLRELRMPDEYFAAVTRAAPAEVVEEEEAAEEEEVEAQKPAPAPKAARAAKKEAPPGGDIFA